MIMGNMIKVKSGNKEIPCYLSKPENKPKAGLIIIEEIWGLNDHIKNVADKFSNSGYLILSPDLLSETKIEEKVTPSLQQDLFNPKTRDALQPKLRELFAPIQSPEFAVDANIKLKACFDYLYNQPGINNNVYVLGFCFGGTYSFNLAIHEPRLKGAIPFYGHASSNIDELRQIKCPILAFYGENDTNLINNLEELKDNMSKAGVKFDAIVYPNCGHAFFNDTNPYSYNEKAASDSWNKAIDFLENTTV